MAGVVWGHVFEVLLVILRLVSLVASFWIGFKTAGALGWVWWKRLLVALVCASAPIVMLAMSQAAAESRAGWKQWLGRFLLALLVVVAAIVVGDSNALRASDASRDTFLGLVYVLSNDAVSIDGSTIQTLSGTSVEIPGRWSAAVFLAAYGFALGLMFLRHSATAAIAFAIIGGIAGGLFSANHYAWCVDAVETPAFATGYNPSYTAGLFLPIWVAPWLALLVLKKTIAPGPDLHESGSTESAD